MTNSVRRGLSNPREGLNSHKWHRFTWIGALILINSPALSGCNDPKEANAKNFTKAIEQHLSQHGEVCLEEVKWPVKVAVQTAPPSWGDFAHSDDNKMAALEGAGLVAWTMDEKKDTFDKAIRTELYSLTDTGRQYLIERNIRNFLGDGFTKRTDLCWGRMRLDEIRKWIGPVQVGHSQVVSVKYIYHIDGAPEWAKTPAIGKAYPAIRELLAGQGNVERNADLQLTNLGWEQIR